MSRESLAALTRGIHHAASTTYTMLAQQYLAMIAQYFEEPEKGREDEPLKAKMTYVQIDEKHWVPIPLISLVAPRGLALERMKVALSVRIEEWEPKQATIDKDGSTADRLSFQVVMSPRTKAGERRSSDVTDIEMEFRAGDPPEAIMRLIDTFTNMIDPRKMEDMMPPTDKWKQTPLSYTQSKMAKDKKDKDAGTADKT